MKKKIFLAILIFVLLLFYTVASSLWFSNLPRPVAIAVMWYMIHFLVVGFLEIAIVALIIPLVFYFAHNIVELIRKKRKQYETN